MEERRHPPEPENLPCPRCDSTNTKFCYYNNYNLSQPRYFCKSCRRYWTRGGTLRNVPVGGATRKNYSKRSRSSSSSSSVAITPPPPPPPPLNTAMFEIHKVTKTTQPISKWQEDMELNVNQGSFTSLLTTTNASGYGPGPGLGYGLGSSGYDDLGFGLGPSITMGDETHAHHQIVGGQNGGNNTWQFSGGEGMDAADCFGWPDLAI